MKKIAAFWLLLLTAASVCGQTNSPIRLALVAESEDAATAVDVLTAQLTGNSKIQLLERDQIDKVYREQEISAANRDDIKLGRILGADGLLLLNVTKPLKTPAFAAAAQSSPPENLTMRLIAVKPGVILTEGTISWPPGDTIQLAQSTTAHLDSFLPKLAVLAKDAIPLSVVNLSSSIQSADALETERELKLLTIQRLSQEPQFFVLERQKMELLSEEKNLKSDETPFWDGSYLLDGIIDQNGYSKDTITVNARLRPPHGGAPLLFEVSGNRTNLSEVVNALALKVAELLKVNPAIKQWDAASEASQYYDEAEWALKWGVYPEAEAAADSSWALGKKDLPCATLQVKAYTSDVSAHVQTYQTLESTLSPDFNAEGKPITPHPSEAEVRRDIADNSAQHLSTLYQRHDAADGTKVINYLFIDAPPDPASVDRALHALELYNNFSRSSPDGEPKILTRGPGWNDWHDSEWYQVGIDDLTAASKVLQNFNFNPGAQPPVADKLADVRALARSVADFISGAPSVHDSYFVGDRIATRDELSHTIEESPNIFRCEVNWGCFWQERPDDAISLYRNLMSSPVFCYIHTDFWNRSLAQPRLVAWNEDDQKNIPAIWTNFMAELADSTNVLWQMEAKALTHADATNDDEAKAAAAGWWDIVHSNRDELVGNNVELFYLGWGFAYNAETEAMDQDYWQKTIPVLKTATAFEKQKQYLENFTPYDFSKFTEIFSSKNYTRAQAAELLPLVVAYKSNLVAKASEQKLFFAKSDAQWIGLILEKPIDQILNPPAPKPAIQRPNPASVAKITAAMATATDTAEIVTNVSTVSKFLPIPLDGLPGDWETVRRYSPFDIITIRAHQWFGGKLVLDFEYGAYVYTFDDRGNWKSTRNASLPAIAILDPSTEQWNVVACPEADIFSKSTFYHRTVLLNGELFNSDGNQIRKYDFGSRQWKVLKVSDGNNYELFAINGHLYAANKDIIFEITDNGESTHILASARRRPPVSVLDSLDDFGREPMLFAGTNNLLQALVGNTIYRWDQNDWHPENQLTNSDTRPNMFADGVLFLNHWQELSYDRNNVGQFYVDNSVGLFRLEQPAGSPELCLWQEFRYMNDGHTDLLLTNAVHSPAPLWQMPPEMRLDALSAALDSSNVYLLADHFDTKGTDATNTYDAELLCFSKDLPQPKKLFLKFDAPDGCPPLSGINPKMPVIFPGASQTWLLPVANVLIFGKESPFNLMPGGGGSGDCKAGVWLLPASPMQTAIATPKHTTFDQRNPGL